MSHDSGGYFTCKYEYHAPYTDKEGVSHVDTSHRSKLYSKAKRNNHDDLDQWVKDTFKPAAKRHVEQVFLNKINDGNTKGLKYAKFDENNLRLTDKPRWSKTEPDGKDIDSLKKD